MTSLGQRLIKAAKEGRAIARGKADPATYRVYVPADVDVKAIRKGLDLSQEEFSGSFGLPVATVRDWEQNRRKPEGAARVLMMVIEKEPEAVKRALMPTDVKVVARQVVRKTLRGGKIVRSKKNASGKAAKAAKRPQANAKRQHTAHVDH